VVGDEIYDCGAMPALALHSSIYLTSAWADVNAADPSANI